MHVTACPRNYYGTNSVSAIYCARNGKHAVILLCKTISFLLRDTYFEGIAARDADFVKKGMKSSKSPKATITINKPSSSRCSSSILYTRICTLQFLAPSRAIYSFFTFQYLTSKIVSGARVLGGYKVLQSCYLKRHINLHTAFATKKTRFQQSHGFFTIDSMLCDPITNRDLFLFFFLHKSRHNRASGRLVK